jgi:hypothetical protein
MIAILRKLSKVYFLLLINCPLFLCAQHNECNKETYSKRDRSKIPSEVCIFPDYVIYNLYGIDKPIDFNKDGLIDFVFSVAKRTTTIGDTSFLVFYKMNADSSFSFSKLFWNVFPIYFNPSDENPRINNPSLQKLINCYPIPDPLDHLDVKNDTIEIVMTMEGHGYEYKVYRYKYEQKYNDWKLIKKTLKTTRFGNSGEEIYENKSLPIKGKDLWLSKFSFCEEE